MKLYEIVLLGRQDLSEDQFEKIGQSYEAFITEQGGRVEKKENWKLRDLAYLIKKNKRAHYVMYNILCTAETQIELDRRFRLDENLLRHLILSIDEVDPNPSFILQKSSEKYEK